MKAYPECSMNWQNWFITIIFVVEFYRDINVTFESLIVVMTRTILFHHDVSYIKKINIQFSFASIYFIFYIFQSDKSMLYVSLHAFFCMIN